MIYKEQEPTTGLKNIIKSFWMIDSENDKSIHREKIIPDGYPELIFHYRSPFKATISGSWFLQDKKLLAGQIRNHFYLENTGCIGIFGIKLQPWSLKLFFDINMEEITNDVISIQNANPINFNQIYEIVMSDNDFKSKAALIEKWFYNTLDLEAIKISEGQKATQLIIDRKGEISIQEVLSTIQINERSLERYFKSNIGLSPKFYSRIIRFSNIFNLVQNKDFDWSDIAYLAGFYDQSHFIRNFKEFTGEEPSKYGFNKDTMANFFLKK